MTDINVTINSDSLIKAINENITENIKDDILSQVKDEVWDNISSEDILYKIDGDGLVEILLDNINMRDLANSLSDHIIDYIDVDDAVSDAMGHYDFLSTEGLGSLMEGYDAVNGCSLARSATNIVGEGGAFLINDYLKNCGDDTGFVRSIADLIKVIVNDMNTVKAVDVVPVIDTETVAELNTVSLTYAEIKAMFYNYNSMFLYYVTHDFPNNWDSFFNEALPIIAQKTDNALVKKLNDSKIMDNSQTNNHDFL